MNATKSSLLSYLKASANEWVSGEMLSRRLGVSRAAIWKHISNLRQEGYEIDSATRYHPVR